MIQVHCCTVFQRVVTVVFLELRQLIRRFTVIAALLTIFKPQQIQRNPALLHFASHILIIRHFVLRLCGIRWEQYFCKLLVGHPLGQRVAEPFLLCQVDCLCNCVPGIIARCRNLAFVESKTVEPQYLTVIGHFVDLLHCIHAFCV